jgi:hypothetical protein
MTVYSALARGREDTLGLGKGRKSEYRKKYECEFNGRGRRVEFGGRCFSSMVEADRFLGLRPGHVSQLFRRYDRQEALARVMVIFESQK